MRKTAENMMMPKKGLDKLSTLKKEIPEFIYNACILTGESCGNLFLSFPRLLVWLLKVLRNIRTVLLAIFINLFGNIHNAFKGLIYKIKCAFKAILIKGKAAKSKGGFKDMLHTAVKVLKEGIGRNKTQTAKLFNYLIPILGILILSAVIFIFSHLTFGLILEYDGVTLGCVEKESIYFSAEKQLNQLIFSQDGDDVEIIPKFKLSIVNKDSFLTSDQVTEKLIAASTSVIEEAAGLYVDDEFVGAVTNASGLKNKLDTMLAKYSTGEQDDIVAFVKDVQVKEGLYPVSSIIKNSELYSKIDGEISGEITYTVQAGDTPYDISRNAGISLDTFYSLNPITKTTFVPGQKVVISSSEPFLSVKVMRHVVEKETVAYKTITTKNNNYFTSYSKVTRKGVNGVNEVTYLVTYINGVASSKERESTKVISNPIDEKITVGTKKQSTVVNGGGKSISGSSGNGKVPRFIWPTSGRISCRWWGYYNHRGLDIAAPLGTPIYAAASGKVISYQNLRGGYGRHIIIDHGNGVQTLYAHTSAVYVNVGDYVKQGQRIAAVGKSGWATGYHLHFGVLINGVYKNPELYLP